MDTYFSVDVETTHNGIPARGVLLTFGAWPILWQPGADPVIGEPFYARVDRSAWLGLFGWYDNRATSDTYHWWADQDPAVVDEAWRDRSLFRLSPNDAAQEFVNWVKAHAQGEAYFVANPVSFDKPWIDDFLDSSGLETPFHYRSVCLRSMRFGLDVAKGFGGARDRNKSIVPHHALHDAYAQALDFCEMLGPVQRQHPDAIEDYFDRVDWMRERVFEDEREQHG